MTNIFIVIGGALVLLVAGYLFGRWSVHGAAKQAAEAVLLASDLESQVIVLSDDKANQKQKINDLKDDVGIKVQELATLNLRLDGVEIMRTDYRQAKVKGGEADRLRREVDTLQEELSTKAVVEDLSPLGHDAAARDNAKSLQEAVNNLLNEDTFAATVVDDAGLQIVSAGVADDALAAFSVLLARACERAPGFVAIGDPYVITLIDAAGTRVSLWPFQVSNRPMALLTLSRAHPATPAINAAISKVRALLPKSFRSLGPGN